MNTDIQLSTALAAQVASAQRKMDEALKIHAEAAAKAGKIASRISETEQRRQEIIGHRLNGKTDPGEAVELHALGMDLEALQRLAGEAKAAADALQPAVEAAQRILASAEQQWHQHVAEAEFNALLTRTREIEDVLLHAIKATAAAGRKIGHRHARQSWTPSRDLERACQGVV